MNRKKQTFDLCEDKRIIQMKILIDVISKVSDGKNLTFLCGDFNSDIHEEIGNLQKYKLNPDEIKQ